MPKVQFGISSFERARGGLPELPVVNMWVEPASTEEGGIVLQSRPGLVDRSADMGSGPVYALFKADGVVNGSLYGVSGTSLYKETTNLGTVGGTGPFSMAGYEDYLFVAGSGPLYSYNGTTFATVTFPDGADVTKVIVGASRLIAIRKNTEQFYWSDPLVTTIDALSFSTAENQPDRLRDCLFIDDTLILFGAETVEFWANQNDPDLPFTPIEGRVMERGIKATGCATKFGSTFAFVTDQNQVCIGDQDGIVSNPGLEAEIKASSSAALFTYFIEGTEFLALRIDTGTWAFNMRSKTFAQVESYGESNWIAQCHAGGVFGSSQDGKTYSFGDTNVDAGGVLERRFRAGFPLNSGSVPINNVILRTNPGNTTYLSGDYVEPYVEMRLSRDAGRTWGNWKRASLGQAGEYRKRVQWIGLGHAAQPGFMAEFRVTDPIDWRVSEVLVNEPFGGL